MSTDGRETLSRSRSNWRGGAVAHKNTPHPLEYCLARAQYCEAQADAALTARTREIFLGLAETWRGLAKRAILELLDEVERYLRHLENGSS